MQIKPGVWQSAHLEGAQMNPLVPSFFDSGTGTATHVVHRGPGSAAAILDSVLDYDQAAGRTGRPSADRIVAFVREQKLAVEWHLETHVHADHLSAAPYLRRVLGGRLGISAQVVELQRHFGKLFNFGIEGS